MKPNRIPNTEQYGSEFITKHDFDDITFVMRNYTSNYIREEENNGKLWFNKNEKDLSPLQKEVLIRINEIIDTQDNLRDIMRGIEYLEI